MRNIINPTRSRDGQVTIVQDGVIIHVGQGHAVQIERDGLVRGDGDIRGHIFQQGHGSIISCRNCIGEGLIIGIADLGNCVAFAQFLHGAIGRLHIIRGDVLGNIGIKSTAGYRCGTAVRFIVMVHNHFLGIAGVLKFAAGNGQFANGIVIGTISRGEQYRGSGIQSLERASSDFSLVPVHNDVLGSIREITTIDSQYTKGIVLDRVDAAGKIAAFDRQIAIGSYIAAIADHAGITASVFNGNASVNLHGAVVGNGVPAISAVAIGRIGTLFRRALKGAAVESYLALVVDSSLSVAGVVHNTSANAVTDIQLAAIFNCNGVLARLVRQRFAAQVQHSSHAGRNRDVLSHIFQQRNCAVFRCCRINSRLQRLIFVIANLGNRRLSFRHCCRNQREHHRQ